MHLNDPQQAAVDFDEGPCLVLAGPGSGKTAVITQRIKRLIEKGVPAQEILVITFTKAAAVEMKERFNRLMENVDSVTFGTFHSLFWGILQKEFGYKSSDILMGNQKTQIIREAMELSGINKDNEDLLSSFIIEISAVDCNFYGIKKYQPKFVDKEDLSKVYETYNRLKTKYRVIDFDDMLTKAYKLFSDNPIVLKNWQSKFSYFMVDEMQDMNDIQFELIKMLSDRTKNIFCVGDDDQSIYGFRGSNPKIMHTFYENYDNCTRILLNVNYRNPENIVKSASKLIANNKNRFFKEIESTALESKINVYSAPDLLNEAKVIVSSIKNDIKTGTAKDDIAVLYRNHSDVRFVVEQLLTENIPFFLKEKAVLQQILHLNDFYIKLLYHP